MYSLVKLIASVLRQGPPGEIDGRGVAHMMIWHFFACELGITLGDEQSAAAFFPAAKAAAAAAAAASATAAAVPAAAAAVARGMWGCFQWCLPDRDGSGLQLAALQTNLKQVSAQNLLLHQYAHAAAAAGGPDTIDYRPQLQHQQAEAHGTTPSEAILFATGSAAAVASPSHKSDQEWQSQHLATQHDVPTSLSDPYSLTAGPESPLVASLICGMGITAVIWSLTIPYPAVGMHASLLGLSAFQV